MNSLPKLIDDMGEVPELSRQDLTHFRPIKEVMSPEFMAMLHQHSEQQRKTRGKQKMPTKQMVTLRLSPEVIAAFKADGKGWQTRINEVLLRHVQQS
ncbi:BrnA antitoxin family protein [Alysiella filiformis]|uniref:Uncharacterized conserved protein, DUF4415 family n=1 Tax=Alysiella filiformis DSM 16848 TaxID=1120981 RepID=A0A286ECB5_9NEIS|nr:BrnA antitoxin family protein [Alysiella filiformis]QMT30624.1 BrnA antitoxin family protein [Alysiella filiformis]UBQ56398.1 BrnA antitoxin family protein [Alysiella filiformis DSM 16848]SOD68474.1 Uncharacterized conserved protein, DUF4415 family [Alysiella filiformis DSM 16848]